MPKRKTTVKAKKPEREINEPAVGTFDNPEIESLVTDTVEPEQILWVNNGGTFRMGEDRNHQIIKPNQKFEATLTQVPKAFRDVIKPVDAERLAEIQKEPTVISETSFTIKEAEEDDMYNVITSAGKKMNQHPMSKEKAEETLEALS